MEDLKLRQAPSLVVETRKVPIDHLNITATTMGASEALFAVRDNVTLEIKRLSVVNVTGAATTLFLHTVPDGGAAATGNAEIFGMSIPANSSTDLTDLIGGLYDSGTTLEVYSGTSAALTIHGWGEEAL